MPKSDAPLVSIIIPTFDRPSLLVETLKNMLQQSFREFECQVIINSDPHPYDRVQKAFEQEERIKFHLCNSNGSSSLPRNFGIRKCHAKYIAFCDDDDLWHPDKLKFQIDFLENQNSLTVLCSNFKIFSHIKEIFNHDINISLPKKIKTTHLLYKNLIPLSSVIMHSKIFAKELFIESNLIADDWEFWLRVCGKHNIYKHHEALLYYRIHNTNYFTSNKWNQRYKFFKTHLNALKNSQENLTLRLFFLFLHLLVSCVAKIVSIFKFFSQFISKKR